MGDYYAGVSVMPATKDEQDMALPILQKAQRDIARVGITCSVNAGNLDDEPVEVDGWLYDETRYNEQTLVKAKDAIETVVRNRLALEDILSALQNAGILFRERLGD